MGKYFDTAEVTRLGKRLNLTLSAHRLDSAGLSPRLKAAAQALGDSSGIMVQPLNEDWIAGWTLLRDIHGNPALLLQTDLPRALYRQGKATVQLLTFALLAIGMLARLDHHLLPGEMGPLASDDPLREFEGDRIQRGLDSSRPFKGKRRTVPSRHGLQRSARRLWRSLSRDCRRFAMNWKRAFTEGRRSC